MSDSPLRLPAPYPGLRPFEEPDHPLFFGREVQVVAMLRQLAGRRFVAVVGSSGSGKSSLVRAGLLPAVQQGFLAGSKDWLIVPPIKPGNDPYGHLATALAGCLPSQVGNRHKETQESLQEVLAETDKGLLDVIATHELPPTSNIMLVVDQFEELFVFRRARQSSLEFASRDVAAAFVAMLLRSCADQDGRVWVVLTMRSDFIGDCEAFLGLPEKVSESQFLVPRLDRRQMAKAIRGPGELTGQDFTPFTFEDGLINQIINEAGDRPDQLPLMQHALMRTWKNAVGEATNTGTAPCLTFANYKKAGGIEEALDFHADAAWEQISRDEIKANIARCLFLLLCDVSPDGQITRRRPQVQEVLDATSATSAMLKDVMRVFQADNRNFLLPSLERHCLLAEDYLDISHESLLRQWKRFADDWLVQEREDASELRRLVEQARLYAEKKGGLLQNEDLDRLLAWKVGIAEEWTRRYVPKNAWENALEFVERSDIDRKNRLAKEQEEINKRTKVKRRALLTAGISLLLFSSVSFWLMLRAEEAKEQAQTIQIQAEKAKESAQKALTTSFVRTIGVANDLSVDEREALWELAGLGSANEQVKTRVIEEWFRTDILCIRAFRDTARGLHAAVGINPNQEGLITSNGQNLARMIAQAMKNSQETNSDRLSSLQEAMYMLTPLLEPITATSVAEDLTTALENPQEVHATRLLYLSRAIEPLLKHLEVKVATNVASRIASRLTNTVESMSDSEMSNIFYLTHELADLAPRLELAVTAAMATRNVQRIARVLINPKESHLSFYRGALTPIVSLVPPTVLAGAAESLAEALQNSQVTTINNFESLKEVLVELSGHLEPKAAASIAQGLAIALNNPKENDANRLLNFKGVLVALAARLEPTVALVIAEDLVMALENPQATDVNRLSNFEGVLVALATRLEPAAAARIAESLANALENPQATDINRLSNFEGVLAAMAARLKPDAAANIAESLTNALDSPEQSDLGRLIYLGRALAVLVAHLDPPTRAALGARGTQRITKALDASHEVNDYTLAWLGDTLAKLGMHLEPNVAAETAGRGAQCLAKALENPQQTDDNRLSWLVDELDTLAMRLEPAAAADIAQRLTKALENPPQTDATRTPTLVAALGALAVRLESAAAADIAQRLTKLLADRQQTIISLMRLGSTLGSLALRLDSPATENLAKELAKILENPQQTQEYCLSSSGNVLEALATQLDTSAAASIAERLAKVLENPQQTDKDRVEPLVKSLVALAERLEPMTAARIAEYLARSLENQQEIDVDHLSSLGEALATLATRMLPTTRETQLLALSTLRLDEVRVSLKNNDQESFHRHSVVRICALLSVSDLVEVLKWPFCVGNAEEIVLAELEKKTGKTFGGALWKFIEMVKNREIKDIDPAILTVPAKRPRVEDALEELRQITGRR